MSVEIAYWLWAIVHGDADDLQALSLPFFILQVNGNGASLRGMGHTRWPRNPEEPLFRGGRKIDGLTAEIGQPGSQRALLRASCTGKAVGR